MQVLTKINFVIFVGANLFSPRFVSYSSLSHETPGPPIVLVHHPFMYRQEWPVLWFRTDEPIFYRPLISLLQGSYDVTLCSAYLAGNSASCSGCYRKTGSASTSAIVHWIMSWTMRCCLKRKADVQHNNRKGNMVTDTVSEMTGNKGKTSFFPSLPPPTFSY